MIFFHLSRIRQTSLFGCHRCASRFDTLNPFRSSYTPQSRTKWKRSGRKGNRDRFGTNYRSRYNGFVSIYRNQWLNSFEQRKSCVEPRNTPNSAKWKEEGERKPPWIAGYNLFRSISRDESSMESPDLFNDYIFRSQCPSSVSRTKSSHQQFPNSRQNGWDGCQVFRGAKRDKDSEKKK